MPLRIADIKRKVEEFKTAQMEGTAEAFSDDSFTALYSYVVMSLAEEDSSVKWDATDRTVLNGTLTEIFPHYLEWREGERLKFRAQINPPKKATGVLRPELAVSYDYKEQPAKRREVAEVMGIADKGHSSHGGNDKSSRTLKTIIDNLFEPCKMWPPLKQEEVAAKLIERYGYSPIA